MRQNFPPLRCDPYPFHARGLGPSFFLVRWSVICYNDSVLSQTAIFPQKEGRKREISNESARGSSFREANV